MKTGKTLTELAAALERQLQSKKDYVVDTRKLHMVEPGIGDVLLGMEHSGEYERLGLTDLAHRQIGETLGIPTRYYQKMREEAPDLLANNVNSWFGRTPKKRMVRTLDGNARAFLSDRYARIDNYDVAKAVLPVLSDLPDIRFESCELTDSRMYISATRS